MPKPFAGYGCPRDVRVEVMAALLERIEWINPAINAIVSLGPRDDLLAAERAADVAPDKGPLHDFPSATKNLVEIAQASAPCSASRSSATMF